MTIILVRHAQSIANATTPVEYRVAKSDRTNSSLTELGIEQARCLSNRLAGEFGETESITLMSSPLHRARDTARIISSELPAAVIIEYPFLQEIVASNEQREVRRAIVAITPDISDFTNDLRKSRDLKIVVTHEWVAQIILGCLIGVQSSDIWFRLANCSVTRLESDIFMRSSGLREWGLSVSSLNDVAHLPPHAISY